MTTINYLDTFVNTSQNLSIHYSLNNDNNFEKMCKIFSIKTGYGEGQVFKGAFRVTAVYDGVEFEETLFYIRNQLGREESNKFLFTKDITKSFTLYYKWSKECIDIYIQFHKPYTIVDFQVLQGDMSCVIFQDNLIFDIISDDLSIVKSTQKTPKTNSTSSITLKNGFSLSSSKVNRVEKDYNTVNLRLNVKGNLVANEIIGTIKTEYVPSIYQEIPAICKNSEGVVLTSGAVQIAFSGTITVISAPVNTTEMLISCSYIAYVN